ncbi:MAG: orotate phosphoribosyltransferase [Deltaproteobacteria bacterium]|nr:orotate phosphoribosyltransferase [Deltaproteobacteria bacterium]MBI3293904.1 orotate phosphoribosyltransferase [Deltaproteobacteria bacterium]
MSQEKIIDLFQSSGAIIQKTHVIYTSGLHGNAYVNKDAIYPDTETTSRLCELLAERFSRDNVETVVGPTVGAVILSQWTAHHLRRISQKRVASIYAEKVDGGFEIRRGYDRLVAQKRVLVVEDVITTGGSVKKVMSEVNRWGGEIVGVAALCNRGGVSASDLGASRLEALLNITLQSWPAVQCPLCAQGVPVNTSIGKGMAP